MPRWIFLSAAGVGMWFTTPAGKLAVPTPAFDGSSSPQNWMVHGTPEARRSSTSTRVSASTP